MWLSSDFQHRIEGLRPIQQTQRHAHIVFSQSNQRTPCTPIRYEIHEDTQSNALFGRMNSKCYSRPGSSSNPCLAHRLRLVKFLLHILGLGVQLLASWRSGCPKPAQNLTDVAFTPTSQPYLILFKGKATIIQQQRCRQTPDIHTRYVPRLWRRISNVRCAIHG